MSKFIIKGFINSAMIYAAHIFIGGFTFSGNAAILFGLGFALAFFHSFIYPMIKIAAFPIVFLSFGMFGFVVNVALLYLAANFTPYIEIEGIMPLLLGGAILSGANFIFSWL